MAGFVNESDAAGAVKSSHGYREGETDEVLFYIICPLLLCVTSRMMMMTLLFSGRESILIIIYETRHAKKE